MFPCTISVLDNPDYIKTKIDMLDNLLEIEVAYSLLKSSSDDTGKSLLSI